MSQNNQSNSAQAALVQVGIVALQSLLRELPGAVSRIRTLLAKDNPTAEDFAEAKAGIEKDSFESLVPNAAKFKKEPGTGDNS